MKKIYLQKPNLQTFSIFEQSVGDKSFLYVFFPKCSSNYLRQTFTANNCQKIFLNLECGKGRILDKEKKYDKIICFMRNHFSRVLSTYYDKFTRNISSGSKLIFGNINSFKEFVVYNFNKRDFLHAWMKDEYSFPWFDNYKDPHIRNYYEILHQGEMILWLSANQKNLQVVDSSMTTEYFNTLEHVQIPQHLSEKIPNSAVYWHPPPEAEQEVLDVEPWLFTNEYWENSDSRLPHKYMYDDEMIALLKEYYIIDSYMFGVPQLCNF